MKLQAGYERTFQYAQNNEHGFTYDVGFHVYQRNDGTFILGYEVVQAATHCRFGSGASRLDFEGTHEEAYVYARVAGTDDR